MHIQSGRYSAPAAATAAEGWTIQRLAGPSRLFGANGIRTGKDGRIYVAQVAGSQVSAVDPDTGAIETISPLGGAIVAPDDLVFDDDGNLYVTEITENQVRMLSPNGSSRVIQGDMPVANPITYHQGRLIAGEMRMGGRIMELDRNGGAPRIILDNLPMVNAFEVGPDGKLYFPVMGANEIRRVSLDGGEPEIVAKDLGVPDSVKFHPDGYIVSTQVLSGQVLRIDPRTGAKSVLADIGAGLDNCSFVGNRTFVSHIEGAIYEILDNGKFRPVVEKGLAMPLGLAMGANGKICIADGNFAYQLRPESRYPEILASVFVKGFPGWIRGIAAAGAGEWIASTANSTVVRWRPDAQESEILASDIDCPMGVAVAPGGAVIFAECGTGRVLSVDRGQTVELATGLLRPMGVAIDADGRCYVAEASGGRVVKLSGGKAETVIDGLGRPEGIVIHGDNLYIVDTAAKNLVACDLSGGRRQVIASYLPVGAPFGVMPKPLAGFTGMIGPMDPFTGITAGADGTIYVAGDADGSIVAIRPA